MPRIATMAILTSGKESRWSRTYKEACSVWTERRSDLSHAGHSV